MKCAGIFGSDICFPRSSLVIAWVYCLHALLVYIIIHPFIKTKKKAIIIYKYIRM